MPARASLLITLYRVIVGQEASRGVMKKSCKPCPPKPALSTRPLLSVRQAQTLESTFKTLGNATRLRMLHALVCAGELCVGELAERLGMKPQAVSNQLQRL